jgi:hypothetical protein
MITLPQFGLGWLGVQTIVLSAKAGGGVDLSSSEPLSFTAPPVSSRFCSCTPATSTNTHRRTVCIPPPKGPGSHTQASPLDLVGFSSLPGNAVEDTGAQDPDELENNRGEGNVILLGYNYLPFRPRDDS